MSWQHFESTQRDDLAGMVDHMDDNGESVEFGEVFGFYYEILPIKLDCFFGLSVSFQQNLFVLACEKARHILYLVHVLFPGAAEFCEFEIFRAVCQERYLQKYFLVGKFLDPLKLTPTTT